MADDINIKGGRQLDQILQNIPVRLQTNILRGALRAGANVFKAEAKSNLEQNGSIDDGELLKSVRVSARLKGSTVTASVKAGNKKAYYWGWVEFGTKPHVIKAARAKGLLFGGNVVAEVLHPGARPRPYLRPALDSKSADAVAAVAEYIKKRLTKEGFSIPDSGNDDENSNA